MALIKCPECGKEVSDKAQICVHCGFPLLDWKVGKIAFDSASNVIDKSDEEIINRYYALEAKLLLRINRFNRENRQISEKRMSGNRSENCLNFRDKICHDESFINLKTLLKDNHVRTIHNLVARFFTRELIACYPYIDWVDTKAVFENVDFSILSNDTLQTISKRISRELHIAELPDWTNNPIFLNHRHITYGYPIYQVLLYGDEKINNDLLLELKQNVPDINHDIANFLKSGILRIDNLLKFSTSMGISPQAVDFLKNKYRTLIDNIDDKRSHDIDCGELRIGDKNSVIETDLVKLSIDKLQYDCNEGYHITFIVQSLNETGLKVQLKEITAENIFGNVDDEYFCDHETWILRESIAVLPNLESVNTNIVCGEVLDDGDYFPMPQSAVDYFECDGKFCERIKFTVEVYFSNDYPSQILSFFIDTNEVDFDEDDEDYDDYDEDEESCHNNSKTLYIYKGNIRCKKYNHNVISATATLHNISDKDVTINVEYCKDCHKYLLSYDLFLHYRAKYGVLIGDFKIITNDFFDGETDLAEESPLHLSGYNVGQKDGYTSNQRHYILAKIIHDGIMTKQEVLNYLSYFVRMNGARDNMELASAKWREDISFVQNYNISTQPSTIITKITRY